MVTILDNYLPDNDHQMIKETMFSNSFPWTVGQITSYGDDLQLCHMFYWQSNTQSSYPIVNPIIHKINPFQWVRIKANLNLKTSEIVEHKFHYDFGHKNMESAIYYVNSNDGYTKFEDGTKVDSVANRLVKFPTTMKHTGTSCTNTSRRIVINFNYFPNLTETPHLLIKDILEDN